MDNSTAFLMTIFFIGTILAFGFVGFLIYELSHRYGSIIDPIGFSYKYGKVTKYQDIPTLVCVFGILFVSILVSGYTIFAF